MSNTIPLSGEINYNEIFKDCKVRGPVFLTKNGNDKFVILDATEYSIKQFKIELLTKMEEARYETKNNGWITFEEMKERAPW